MKTYKVLCAKTKAGSIFKGRWIPVNGHAHADPELGTDWKHYHIDWRFLTRDDRTSFCLGADLDGPDNYIFVVIPEKYVEALAYKYFTMPEEVVHEPIKRFAGWHVLLEKHYGGMECKGKRCPHRGADLSDCVPDEKGVITCPYHGLNIDSKTFKVLTPFISSARFLEYFMLAEVEVKANRRNGRRQDLI